MRKSKEIIIRNYKTEDEALEILKSKIDSIESDYVVYYVQMEDEDEDDEDLITVESEDELHREELDLHVRTVLMAGRECKRAKEGMKVVFNDMAVMNCVKMVLGDIIFFLIPEKSIIAYLK